MDQALPIFNWSLRKALDTVPDSLGKARVRIVYTVLLFSLTKCLIVTGVGIAHEQWFQAWRAIIVFVLYTLVLKVMLSRPAQLKRLAHCLILAGTLVVWTSVFFYTHSLNILSAQFVFMIMLSSFYTLGGRWGFIYSAASLLPIVLLLAFKGNVHAFFNNKTQELASPGAEIITVLNFISIAIAHYLFYHAFDANIREKEKLNNQLQLAIVEANRLAESKANFLSTMSHELRTPLNSVIGLSELLLQNNTDNGQHKNLQVLRSSSQDLLSLVNNILDFNKTDADKMELESVPFRLAELVETKCSGLQLKMQDKHLDFVLDIDPQLERTVVVSDPLRLSQVIYNLLSNAIKFTEQGSITVRLNCLRKAEHSVDVLLSVTDTGIGIAADKHEAVFEMFAQAGSHITRSYGGTGLGLAIVRQILALFHSSIQLESTPGKGSRFSFLLSLPTAEEAPPAKAAAPEATDFRHLKILIAEDNSINRLLLKKQMEKLELDPLIVENGLLACEACQADDYDLVFLDLHMPVLDGYEAIRRIRSLDDPDKANVTVIAFTASIAEQQKIMDAGFDDFLHKPAGISELRSKLGKLASLPRLSFQK